MMRIKWNWGKGLLLGMGAFMLFITAMGIYMFMQSPDDFDHQYYEKGLAYDSVYNQKQAVVMDKVQPKITLKEKEMQIEFVQPANGSVHFERVAEPGLDKIIMFEAGEGGELNIDLAKFKKGRWDLTFNWANHGKKYMYYQKINLQ